MKFVYKNFAPFHSVGKFNILMDKQIITVNTWNTIPTVSMLSNEEFKILKFPPLPKEAKFLYANFMTAMQYGLLS